MGTWGTGVFSDDTACDVRDEFRDLIGDGLTPESATQRLVESYRGTVDDPDDGPLFWIALALTQWPLGRLVPAVSDRAIALIDNGTGLDRWTDPTLRRKRQSVLARARADLLSPQRAPVRVAKRRRSATPFTAGDVVAYTHDSGRVACLWVHRNSRDKGGTYSNVIVAAVGDPDLPSVEEIVSGDVPAFDIGHGVRSAMQLAVLRCEQLEAERWRVLGNVQWPQDRQLGGGWRVVWANPPARAKRRQSSSLDRALDACFSEGA